MQIQSSQYIVPSCLAGAEGHLPRERSRSLGDQNDPCSTKNGGQMVITMMRRALRGTDITCTTTEGLVHHTFQKGITPAAERIWITMTRDSTRGHSLHKTWLIRAEPTETMSRTIRVDQDLRGQDVLVGISARRKFLQTFDWQWELANSPENPNRKHGLMTAEW